MYSTILGYNYENDAPYNNSDVFDEYEEKDIFDCADEEYEESNY